MRAAEGSVEEVKRLFCDMVEWVTENESGTVTYTCNQSNEDPQAFMFLERYTNLAALEAHSSSDRMKELISSLAGKLEGGLDVQRYEEIAAKL